MKALLFFLALFSSLNVLGQTTQKLAIDQKSTFTLRGTSNVNSFSCSIIDSFCGEELDVCFTKAGNTISFDNAQFKVEVAQFDCQNKLITRDMQKTLEEEEYPHMNFKLLKINNWEQEPTAELQITIAGKTNLYNLKYGLVPVNNQAFKINLNTSFYMSEFDIVAPRALLGLVKVNETIEVDIELFLTSVE